MKSIALPAIGTGVSGFPMEECAHAMLAETIQHLQNGSSLERVHFVLFDAVARDAFQTVWEQLKKALPSGAATA